MGSLPVDAVAIISNDEGGEANVMLGAGTTKNKAVKTKRVAAERIPPFG